MPKHALSFCCSIAASVFRDTLGGVVVNMAISFFRALRPVAPMAIALKGPRVTTGPSLLNTLDISHENVIAVPDSRIEQHPAVIGAEHGMSVARLGFAGPAAAQAANIDHTVWVGHQRHVVLAIPVVGTQVPAIANNQCVGGVGLNVSRPGTGQEVLPDPGAIRPH